MAVAFTGAMTASASAQTRAVKLPAAIAASGPCGDGNGYNGANRFWRCTGSSVTSDWVASTSCDEGEYNAITYYNAWGAINNCSTRVWLHQYMRIRKIRSSDPGWAMCLPAA